MIVPLDHTIYDASVTRSKLCVELADGRSLCAPLEWFPLLNAAKPDCRENFEITDDGLFVHWPHLGERISVEFLMARRSVVTGRKMGEG